MIRIHLFVLCLLCPVVGLMPDTRFAYCWKVDVGLLSPYNIDGVSTFAIVDAAAAAAAAAS